MEKNIAFTTKNKNLIDVMNNHNMYYIPSHQMGFTSQRQLIEIAIEFLLDQDILIKREVR